MAEKHRKVFAGQCRAGNEVDMLTLNRMAYGPTDVCAHFVHNTCDRDLAALCAQGWFITMADYVSFWQAHLKNVCAPRLKKRADELKEYIKN